MLLFCVSIPHAVIKHVQNETRKRVYAVSRLMDVTKYRGGILGMYENNVVKSRQVGGSVVVTMPGGEAQIHSSVSKTLGGTYIYTPMVRRSVRPSSDERENAKLDNFGDD